MGDLVRRETAVHDRLFHGDMVPRCSAAMKTHCPSIDDLFGAKSRRSMDLRAKAERGKSFGPRNPRFACVKTGCNFLGVVADRGYDAHAGDDNAPHPFVSTVSRPAPVG
jgi:hypothetical protein